MKLGYNVTLITETCNESVIRAAVDGETRLHMPNHMHRDLPPMLQFDTHANMKFCFVESPSLSSENESELKDIWIRRIWSLLVAVQVLAVMETVTL